jgi:RNA polymerase sigma-70 factor (ECF subfamily)
LEHLCQVYWPPLYAYVRRRGHPPADAQDLTQAFFCHFLTNNLIGVADQAKGKFRTFLLTSLSHFLHSEQVRAQAQKRGGQQPRLSFDNLEAEEEYQAAAATREASPEKVFDRRWAQQILAQARASLRKLYQQEGKAKLYERLESFLAADAGAAEYLAAALELEMTPGAVRTAVHRLRHRYGEMIRREVARTVGSEEEVEREYVYLRELLAETGL